ncbi:hypothetical protein FA15DRAFT_668727 [Coprinopsis marcescibilis]|uniref:BZIP domain-containing protein n=1 Tax=Coprinopsis marcescibilis TaxID=230819 RepID=A0A5C3KXI9_COPMA|nr:hypothetical protein FA15DRAFT_668727 [Coprinopsis marcescibilis]
MPSSNLQGLNIVQPVVHTDSHDLLAGQQYSDLSAQLDLWTNLSFDNEEPLGARGHPDEKYSSRKSDDDGEEARSPVTTEKAVHDGHVNVVTGTNIGTNESSRQAPQQNPAFDISTFLAGFGIDPYSIPQPQQQPIAPSLAQLLAFHSAAAAQIAPQSFPPQLPVSLASTSNLNLPSFHHQEPESPTLSAQPSSQSAASAADSQPATKRARTRKLSISTTVADSPEPESHSGNSFSAAEDKRRRNTAASARFRLKKKEREAALEGKAKELEQKVSELERECEGLRRENGWLKGLVVGVTGAAQGPVPPPLISTPHSLSSLTTSSSSKRRRDDGEGA